MVKASALRTADPGFDPSFCRVGRWGGGGGGFSRSNHISDLKIGTPVAALPGAWRYKVSAGTGWPSASVL